MAYIDKILYYDEHDRYIQTENKEEGWDGWGFNQVSVRHRASTKDRGDLVAIELWDKDGNDCQEVILTRQNAMRLADTLKMAVVEFTVEDMLFHHNRELEHLNNAVDWLRPVIEREKAKWKKGRK